MINLGLGLNESQYYYNLLKSSHQVHIAVHLIDHYGNVLLDCSNLLIAGSVDIDASADITRSAKLTLADPGYQLGLDGPNVNAAWSNLTRMFRIYYGVSELGASPIYWCPVFTGPITDTDREGGALLIECMGKEIMAKEGSFRALTFPAGWIRAQAHSYWLYQLIGEPWVAHYSAKPWITFPTNWYLEAGTDVWAAIKDLMYAIGLHSYYDTYGTAVLKDWPTSPVFTFDTGYITSEVKPVYDYGSVVNAVRVVGGTPEGWAARWEGEYVLPWYHPLSADNLARTPGVPRYITEFVEDDTLVTGEQVDQVGIQTLQDRTLVALDVNFTSFVVPTLEENDVYLVNSPEYYGVARLVKASIPLVGDGEMSVGFLSTSASFYATTTVGNMVGMPDPWPLIEARKKAERDLAQKQLDKRNSKPKPGPQEAVQDRTNGKKKKNKKKKKKFNVAKEK